MTKIDLRVNEDILSKLIGQHFLKYSCDEFIRSNAVHGIVGLWIGNNSYALRANLQPVDILGEIDDLGFLSFAPETPENIQSIFDNCKLIENTIYSVIEHITLVNEFQILERKIDNMCYESMQTRALLFKFKDNHELLFEKDIVMFSDSIEINKGYKLLSKISDVEEFLDGWNEFGVTAKCQRKFIEI